MIYDMQYESNMLHDSLDTVASASYVLASASQHFWPRPHTFWPRPHPCLASLTSLQFATGGEYGWRDQLCRRSPHVFTL